MKPRRLLLLAAIFCIGFIAPQIASAATTPDITTQPVSQSLLAGANATFFVVATGQATLLYQWSLNGTNLSDSIHINGATNTTLIVSNLVAADAGAYRVVVSNSHGTATSSNVTLTVWVPPVITNQPLTQTVVVSNNCSLTVQASGTAPLSYQWQKGGVNLSDGGTVSGTTTATLNLTGVQTNDAGAYQVIVTNNYGAATSVVATLTVVVPATIAIPLTNQVTMVYSNVTLAVTANGTATLFYQWQKGGVNLTNGASITGADGPSLTISNPQLADAGQYGVIVSNAWGTTASTETLVVAPVLSWGIAVTTPPASVTNVMAIASAGTVLAADFAVRADGLVIGWGSNFYGVLDIPADATNLLTITAGPEQAIAVRPDGSVVSWGYGGTAVPDYVTNVVAAAVQSYGSCLALRQDGTVVTWNGASTPPASATNVIAIGAGFYHCLAVRQDGTIVGWGDNTYGETTPPAQATNILAVGGGALGAYVYSMALRADGTAVSFGYAPGIPAEATNLVAIAPGNSHWMGLKQDGTAMSWGLSGPSPTNCVAIAASGDGYHDLALVQDPNLKLPPRFIQQPLSAVTQTNRTVILLSRVIGSSPMQFQWYFNDAPLAGQTNNWLLLSALQTGQGGNYQVVVTNIFGSVTSEPVVVWLPPVINAQPSATVIFGSNASFSITATGTPPFGYQWCFNGVPLTDGGRIVGSTTTNFTIANFQPTDLGNYTVVITNLSGSITSAVATVTVLNPLISTQPQNKVVLGGATVSFSVTATGQQPLTYQWLFNGTNLDGATSNPLVLTNVLVSQSGTYSVIVTNVYGMAASSNASLSVAALTITTQPTNRVAWLNGSAVFKVNVSGTAPFSYEWQCNQVDVPGIQTNLLVLTNLQANQFGTYSVIVGNAYGSVVSSNATLSLSQVAVWGGNSGETNLTTGLTNIIAVAGGQASTMDCVALRSNGTVVTWPTALFGFQLSGVSNLIAVASTLPGYGLRPNGTVVQWNYDGGTIISGLTNIVAISGNNFLYLALTASGKVMTPATVAPPKWTTNGIVAVAEGYQHNLVLRADGTPLAWGNNTYGQTNVPPGLSNVVAIAAGGYHNLALKADGTVVGWGQNNYGQTNIPAGLSDVVAIAAGMYHSLALKSNGTVVAWGMNIYGQTNVPAGLTNVIAISAGQYHSMALIGNGPPVTQAVLTNPTDDSNGFNLSLPSQSGKVYVLQYKDSLSDSNWTSLPLVPGTGGILQLSDPAATHSQRFYRVQRW